MHICTAQFTANCSYENINAENVEKCDPRKNDATLTD